MAKIDTFANISVTDMTNYFTGLITFQDIISNTGPNNPQSTSHALLLFHRYFNNRYSTE